MSKRQICLYLLVLVSLFFSSPSPSEGVVILQGYKDKNPSATNGDVKVDLTWDSANVRYQDNDTAYEYVLYGRYPQMQQAGTPLQPILWRVLRVDGGTQALVLSDKNLDVKQFHTDTSTQKWKDSSLRKWMNSESVSGFNEAPYFTASEQGGIVQVTHETPFEDGSDAGISPTQTTDAFFALSYQDLISPDLGFSTTASDNDENRKGVNTAYLYEKYGSSNNMNEAGTPDWWWTRSPYSGLTFSAWLVLDYGYLLNYLVSNTGVAVRPACFLNLESLIFKSASVFSSSAGVAGSRDNPYLLYLSAIASQDLTASATVTGSLNGNKLTLSFSGMPLADYPNVFHAYMDYVGAPAPNNLKTAFILSDATTVTAVEFKGASIELTLSKNYAYGETAPTLSYLGNAATDGIGFIDTGTVPTRLDTFTGLSVTNDTPNPGGGDPGTGDPGTTPNPTPAEAAKDFNGKDKGVQIEFPNISFTDPNGVKDQLGGMTPNLLGNNGISRTTLTPAQGDDENHSFFGKGWGAKIDIQLKSSTAAGRIDILPVKLTFLLDSADLKEAGWVDTDVAGNTAAFLAKALLTKVLAEGDQGEHDLTALLADIIAVKSDGRGGVTVELPFLLANGKGDPKLITDGGKKYLVIFDGDRNGWLRDPVWLYRRAVVPTAITLTATPNPLTLKKGESGAVKAVFTPADATERGLVWSVSVPAVASVTNASAEDTWTIKGLSEGTAILTATASTDSKVKATVAVTVTPAESDLFKTFAVSPEPPYRRGTEIEILASLNRAASSVKATVKRPDGGMDTPTVNVEGTEAWTAYTLEALGNYTVTVEAVDAVTGGVWSRMAVLTVEEGGATGSSSSGGCNAADGIVLLPLVFLGLSRTRRK